MEISQVRSLLTNFKSMFEKISLLGSRIKSFKNEFVLDNERIEIWLKIIGQINFSLIVSHIHVDLVFTWMNKLN